MRQPRTLVDDVKDEMAKLKMQEANLGLKIRRLQNFLDLSPDEQEEAFLLMVKEGILHEKIQVTCPLASRCCSKPPCSKEVNHRCTECYMPNRCHSTFGDRVNGPPCAKIYEDSAIPKVSNCRIFS